MRPDEICHFALCGMTEARAALFAFEDAIAATACQRQASAAAFSSEILRSLNLIDGVISASGQSIR